LGACETQKSKLELESRASICSKLFDPSAADVVSIVIVALSALCIYLAYDITRITSGAPKAWYVIILAFAVLLVRRATQAYLDILSPSNDVDVEEALVTLVVVALFVVGLLMLDRTFRKQVMVSQGSSG
jgi:hypothetical protein